MLPAPPVALALGTYNRLPLLKASIESARRAAGTLPLLALVADGGSSDGSREWLAEQPDCVILEGGIEGAVRAFNVAFGHAVYLGCPYVVQWNDDFEFAAGAVPQIEAAVAILEAEPLVGAVTLESQLRGEEWDCERYFGIPMLTQAVIRLEAGMAAARAEGDPTGRAWWGATHHTYAADTVLSCWIWRLGWEIRRGTGLRVHDRHHLDGLRECNVARYLHGPQSTVAAFTASWGRLDALKYSREEAARFGGVVR